MSSDETPKIWVSEANEGIEFILHPLQDRFQCNVIEYFEVEVQSNFHS